MPKKSLCIVLLLALFILPVFANAQAPPPALTPGVVACNCDPTSQSCTVYVSDGVASWTVTIPLAANAAAAFFLANIWYIALFL
jgi:hypothetical protein